MDYPTRAMDREARLYDLIRTIQPGETILVRRSSTGRITVTAGRSTAADWEEVMREIEEDEGFEEIEWEEEP